MFRGATLVNLDSKGRLSVPTRYREQLLENAAGQMVCWDYRRPRPRLANFFLVFEETDRKSVV